MPSTPCTHPVWLSILEDIPLPALLDSWTSGWATDRPRCQKSLQPHREARSENMALPHLVERQTLGTSDATSASVSTVPGRPAASAITECLHGRVTPACMQCLQCQGHLYPAHFGTWHLQWHHQLEHNRHFRSITDPLLSSQAPLTLTLKQGHAHSPPSRPPPHPVVSTFRVSPQSEHHSGVRSLPPLAHAWSQVLAGQPPPTLGKNLLFASAGCSVPWHVASSWSHPHLLFWSQISLCLPLTRALVMTLGPPR